MKNIIILGRAIGWDKAPDDTDCWVVCSAVSRALSKGKKVVRAFDLHDFSLEDSSDWKNDEEKLLLDKDIIANKIPFYLVRKDSKFPTSIKYPLKAVIDKYGNDYFINSLCYMIALAMYEGIEKIDLYGINMAAGAECAIEKCGVEFWLGIAMGIGLEVTVHGARSELLVVKGRYGKGRLYGYGIKQGEIL